MKLYRWLCDLLIPDPEPPPKTIARPRPGTPYSPTIYTEAEWAEYERDGRPVWRYDEP